MAACVATLLKKEIEDIDVDVASCNSLAALVKKIEEKAKCKLYVLSHEAVVDRVAKLGERYCIVQASCAVNGDPCDPSSTWHTVVCEIAEDGKLSLVLPQTSTPRVAWNNSQG
jgi:hypothetical protein